MNDNYWKTRRKENILWLALSSVLCIAVTVMIFLAPPKSKNDFICMVLGIGMVFVCEVYFISMLIKIELKNEVSNNLIPRTPQRANAQTSQQLH